MKLISIGMIFTSAMAFAAGISQAKLKLETAIFAGGSFRYMEYVFDNVYGVIDTEVGYTGGTTTNPTPANYMSGGHLEAVRITFDAKRVGFKELLDLFFRRTNPLDSLGQFTDRGVQYRTAVFFLDEGQKKEAEEKKASFAKSLLFGAPLKTEITKAPGFFGAGKASEGYAKKNPAAFESYVVKSGRMEFFAKIWGESDLVDTGLPPTASNGVYKKPSRDELRKRLSRMQYEVTQNEGTEPAYNNEYSNNHEEGIYVDIVSGEVLFSSLDKYDSGTGWPSFFMPLVPGNVKEKTDTSYGMVRVEVRSAHADSHLGHVFDDGPGPTGLRYCMNSASLRFVPVKEMEKEGYGKYLEYFRK